MIFLICWINIDWLKDWLDALFSWVLEYLNQGGIAASFGETWSWLTCYVCGLILTVGRKCCPISCFYKISFQISFTHHASRHSDHSKIDNRSSSVFWWQAREFVELVFVTRVSFVRSHRKQTKSCHQNINKLFQVNLL